MPPLPPSTRIEIPVERRKDPNPAEMRSGKQRPEIPVCSAGSETEAGNEQRVCAHQEVEAEKDGIALKPGDLVQILQLVSATDDNRTNDKVAYGKVIQTGAVGKFPLDATGRVLAGDPSMVRSIYPFRPERQVNWLGEDGALVFDTNVTLEKLCVHRNSDEWAFGRMSDGRTGWFPSAYVKKEEWQLIIPSLPRWHPAT